MKRAAFIFFILIASTCLISCEGSLQFEELNPQTKTEAPLFWDDISTQVMIPYCVQCHRSYARYSFVYADREEILNLVETNKMPLRMRLPEPLKRQLRQWIDAGALEF